MKRNRTYEANEPGLDVFNQTGINKKLNNLLGYDDFEKTWQPEKQKATKRTDVGLDIINEGVDDNYDYEGGGWLEPITFELIKEKAIEILRNWNLRNLDVELVEVQKAVEKFAKRKMHGFHDEIAYMEENNEGDFENIANGNYD